MRIDVQKCGSFANDSEVKSVEHLKAQLNSRPETGDWILLTNLMFSVNQKMQADEIDILAIGAPGVRLIEVKHWSSEWMDAHKADLDRAADALTQKAKRVGTTLRQAGIEVPFVEGVILLSQEPSRVKRHAQKEVRGIRFCTLNDWRTALGSERAPVIDLRTIRNAATILKQGRPTNADPIPRALGGYVNLQRISRPEDRFHRVLRGKHATRSDKVVMHLFDLSAFESSGAEPKGAEDVAQREFRALQAIQLYRWAPRVLDSFQDLPDFAGEMSFFTILDPEAPPISVRAKDTKWPVDERLYFARSAVKALRELHEIRFNDAPIIHRNLSPATILVRSDNTPILTGFQYSRLPQEGTIASTLLPSDMDNGFVAPEVVRSGLGAADQRSDIFALCASLVTLVSDTNDAKAVAACTIFADGMSSESPKRVTLVALEKQLSTILGDVPIQVTVPPVRYWTEDLVIPFRSREYRIVMRLGTGGIGTTFKVVDIDSKTKEILGTYVAKVVGEKMGERVLYSYRRVRSYLEPPTLSMIYEIAEEWKENQFVALMKWVPGSPLSEWMGMLPLLAEGALDGSCEELVMRWLGELCRALDRLHGNGLVHGDVSPRNIILDENALTLTLTDYDLVCKIGDIPHSPGAIEYCSPEAERLEAATASDDFYALAATFFHTLYQKRPFHYGGTFEKGRGLNWEGIDRTEYPHIVEFLDRATHHDPAQRVASVAEAIVVLETIPPEPIPVIEPPPMLQEEHVEWLTQLLHSYPGSRIGNRETRGLDTPFAEMTYVETRLEQELLDDIRHRRLRLVVLCGNAGDGKTALLQHLAKRLNLGVQPSSQRILQGQTLDGPLVRMNLDGSAALQGKSADTLLNEFLAPFLDGPPQEDIVHLLAINDGRLLEWIEQVQQDRGQRGTALTRVLETLLQGEESTEGNHVRFITLNQRSLVGGVDEASKEIETHFLDRLVDGLLGGDQAPATWRPCLSCSAKTSCEVFRTVRLFGPEGVGEQPLASVRHRARTRLFEALQAVHLGGETHITMRELRSALVYILFGLHDCAAYHEGSDATRVPYWERAFNADSPARQGEVLQYLVRLDPALEADAQLDRQLVSLASDEREGAPRSWPLLPLPSARRRAFFEWSEEEIKAVAHDGAALDLARGKHLRAFRNLPLMDKQELAEVRKKLCRGIARLEDLPPQAQQRPGVVPLRITPRTPTETAFWVEKPQENFEIRPLLPERTEGIEVLHRLVELRYHFRNGMPPETLTMGAELFHLLMELAEGYQLGDTSTDESFANLSVFVQRLVQEDERELLAWSPMQDEKVYRVFARMDATQSGVVQRMVIEESKVDA